MTFAIDSNGIVSVSARDLATNQSQSIQINPAGGLSKEEIERLVQEADQFAQQDAQKRDIRRLRNRIEGLIYTNEKVYQQFRDALGEKDRKKVSDTLLRSRVALGSDSRADLETALFDLNSISRQLSEMLLASTGEKGLDKSSGGGGS